MKNPKTQLTVGVVFLAAGLALAGSHLYDYLSGNTSGERLLISLVTAGCGLLWGGLQVREGLRRMKRIKQE